MRVAIDGYICICLRRQRDEVERLLLLTITTIFVVGDQDPLQKVNPVERGCSSCQRHVCTEGGVVVSVSGEGELHLHGDPLLGVHVQALREGGDFVRGEADVRVADGATSCLVGGSDRPPQEESGLVCGV